MIRQKTLPALLLLAGITTLAGPRVALAGELEELKAQLQALQSRIEKMEDNQKQAASVKAVVPAGASAASGVTVGTAQSPLSLNVGGGTVTLYGNLDAYLNYMKSSSGATIASVQDGAALRSRIGFKGDRAINPDYVAKFQLEQGFNLTNGSAADTANASTAGLTTSGRLFDRQAWAGVQTPYGEFRLGRQNTAIFARGDYFDLTSRTLGSMVNNFGVPSRYDGDLSWISPRWHGLLAEAHYAFAGANPVAGTATTTSNISPSNMAVYQFALDYLYGPFRIGYAGIEGRPDYKGTVKKNAEYHSFYANYDYGRGKLYAAFVRSNNGGANGNGSGALSNVGGSIVGNNPTGSASGSLNAGLAGTGLDIFYEIYQLSADYFITPQWRVGGLWGTIKDTTGQSKGAKGWALASYYNLNSNLMLYALLDSVDNQQNGNWGPAGSAGLTKTFSGTDRTGQKIDGIQTGFVFKF